MKLYSSNKDYKLYHGNMLDMLEVIEPNSIDSIITDPPYGLTSITKRFGKETSATNQYGRDGSFQRLTKGFMGKEWDGSGIEYNVEAWQKCYEVLKPGGYLLAFGGSRTFHRIACAIEDAGFEIRDTIMWLYGSGFPKSMDISKSLDKKNKNTKEEYIKFGKWIQQHRENKNISRLQLGQYCFNFDSKREDVPIIQYETAVNIPKKEIYLIIKEKLNLDDSYDWLIEREEAEREIIGKKESGCFNSQEKDRYTIGSSKSLEVDITIPSTDLAKQWQGWGTALKPSYEPIIVARKPFKGSLVDNVIEYGVGGINIDECRVGNEELHNSYAGNKNSGFTNGDERDEKGKGMFSGIKKGETIVNGRFPANTILTYDDTDFDEVCGGFPNGGRNGSITKKYKINNRVYGDYGYCNTWNAYQDSGSASRYFYCAKASKKDRDEGLDSLEIKKTGELQGGRKEGSAGSIMLNADGTTRVNPYAGIGTPKRNNHPTVKPTELMQYLIRLVTPKGGVILDPFNGSGSTGKAVMYENKERNKNYKYIGIELTAEYLPISKARIEYVCNLKKEVNPQISIFDLEDNNE